MGKVAGVVTINDGDTLNRNFHNGPISIDTSGANITIHLAMGGADIVPSDTNQDEYYWITNADAIGTLTIKIVANRLPIVDLKTGGSADHVTLAPGETGVFAQQLQQVPYITVLRSGAASDVTVPPATPTSVGGVSVPAAGGLSVTAGGALSINPGIGLNLANNEINISTATPTVIGGVKVAVNSGISLSSGFISFNAGAGLNVDGTTGTVSIAAAQAGALGGVEIPANSGLTNTGGALSVAPATAASVGGVKVPATGGLAVAGDGSLSYTGQGTPFATYKEFITSASAYTAAQQIFAEYQPVAWTLPVNGGTSKFGAVNAAGSATTTTSTVNIQKNGVTVGTLSYAPGAAGATVVATIAIASAVSFAVGDLLSLVVGATPDANFVNVFGTFIGTHN